MSFQNLELMSCRTPQLLAPLRRGSHHSPATLGDVWLSKPELSCVTGFSQLAHMIYIYRYIGVPTPEADLQSPKSHGVTFALLVKLGKGLQRLNNTCSDHVVPLNGCSLLDTGPIAVSTSTKSLTYCPCKKIAKQGSDNQCSQDLSSIVCLKVAFRS